MVRRQWHKNVFKCNEGKFVVTERFIKTFLKHIYKHMTAVSKMFILMFYMLLSINTITYTIELLKNEIYWC